MKPTIDDKTYRRIHAEADKFGGGTVTDVVERDNGDLAIRMVTARLRQRKTIVVRRCDWWRGER